jgi:formate hydrogenlyase subunit 4
MLGAALATLATIRVVRALSSMFEGLEERRSALHRRSGPPPADPTDDAT